MRGGSWNNNQDNARCAVRNRNQPDNRNNNNGFRVVLLCSAHVPLALLLVPPRGGMAHRDYRPGCVPAMRADLLKRVCPPRRRKKNSARLVWSAHNEAIPGRRLCRAYTENWVRPGRTTRRTRPTQSLQTDFVCRIHPPNSLPMLATMRLTCSYCPLLSQSQ